MKGSWYALVATLFASLGSSSQATTVNNNKGEARHLLNTVLPENVLAISTNLVDFAIRLFPNRAPITVDNFLNYVNDGDYNNAIFHRFVPGFVLQGGGFTVDQGEGTVLTPIPTDASIPNEPGLQNTKGSIAMAKLGSDPDSATSQWFINIADNSGRLDDLSGGFTVFARMIDMNVMNLFSQLAAADLSNTWGSTFRSVAVVENGGGLLVIQSIQGSGLVSGAVFDDVNQSGQQDDGEQGLEGIVVYSDSNGNQQWDDGEISTTTNDDGSFALRLNSGSHYVALSLDETQFVTVVNTQTVFVPIGREVSNFDFAAVQVTSAPSFAPSVAPSESPTEFPSSPPVLPTTVSSITSPSSSHTESSTIDRATSGSAKRIAPLMAVGLMLLNFSDFF